MANPEDQLKQYVDDLLQRQRLVTEVSKDTQQLYASSLTAASKEIEKLIAAGSISPEASKVLQKMTEAFIQLSIDNVKQVTGNRPSEK